MAENNCDYGVVMKSSYPKLHSLKMKNEYNVEKLDIVTSVDLNPNDVLLAAINNGMDKVIVIGYDKNGEEYFASSYADGPNVAWLCNRMIHMLMKIADERRGR